MKVGLRLTISHLCLAVFSVLATGGILGYFAVMRGTEPILEDAARGLKSSAVSRLVAVRDSKAKELQRLFFDSEKDVGLLCLQAQMQIENETARTTQIRKLLRYYFLANRYLL